MCRYLGPCYGNLLVSLTAIVCVGHFFFCVFFIINLSGTCVLHCPDLALLDISLTRPRVAQTRYTSLGTTRLLTIHSDVSDMSSTPPPAYSSLHWHI
jgi:hypothetical protein